MRNTKLPKPLSAQDKSSFAYTTVKERLPKILVKIIDFLHRLHGTGLEEYSEFIDDKQHLADVAKETTRVVAALAKLRNELETNKPIETFIKHRDASICDPTCDMDLDLWNEFIVKNCGVDGSLPQWFVSPWLLVETFFYRKIKEAFSQTLYLKRFDPFCEQKRAACQSTMKQMVLIANYIQQLESKLNPIGQRNVQVATYISDRTLFMLFAQLSLWANRSDLSLSGMSASTMASNVHDHNIQGSLDKLKANILCNNLSQAWECFESLRDQLASAGHGTANTNKYRLKSLDGHNSKTKEYFIDIVADNSGYELFVDLCLMHCLDLLLTNRHADNSTTTTTTNTTKSISPSSCEMTSDSDQPQQRTNVKLIQRLHVKRIPWFVSDTQVHDVKYMLELLSRSNEPALSKLGEVWLKKFNVTQEWRVHDHMFWTLPHDYAQMQDTSPDLYAQLRGSSLLIFKGDLNYRKLTGDLQWNILTPFKEALRGFLPAPLLVLRTCKAHVVVGIEDMEIYAKINNNELPRDWMTSGEYALIQLACP